MDVPSKWTSKDSKRLKGELEKVKQQQELLKVNLMNDDFDCREDTIAEGIKMLKSLAKKFEADQDGENKHVFISDLYRDMLVNDVEKLNTSHDSD